MRLLNENLLKLYLFNQ